MLSSPPLSLPLRGAVIAIAAAALAVPALIVANPPAIPVPPRPRPPVRVVPPAELPPVEPLAYQDLSPDAARAWNARVPFVGGPNPAARPLVLTATGDDRARAIDCMAAAMLYEAGDDPPGERAVGQVVINRARHPAFPKTICGVVFQGQERTTGCQFTFTCDGAIARAPNPDSWQRAQRLAEAALTGTVFGRVGHSTHYHTDWVVPYWSASLDKVAELHTHLFFRWTGWWGTPPAFRRTVASSEPVIPKLAAWSPAHALGTALDDAAGLMSEAAALDPSTGAALAADPDAFLVTLDRAVTADLLPAFARRACGERDHCRLMGWNDRRQTPAQLPLAQAQVATMAFSYLRDRARGFDKPLWNCAVFPRTDKRECMKVQVLTTRPDAEWQDWQPSLRAAPTPGASSTANARPTPRATLRLPAASPAATPRTAPSPLPAASATPPRTPPPARP